MIKKTYYALLDLVTQGKGIKRTFSGNDVQMPVRYYKYFSADYESDNLSIINAHIRPGMKIIDVGAHIGLMSVIFSKKTGENGRVYSFEPTPSTFRLLQKTILLNQAGKTVKPVNAALSEQSGETTFYISGFSADNSNSLVDNHRTDRSEQGIRVKLYSIDDFVRAEGISNVDFIKIDAEGAELSVLKGTGKTIQQFRPKMILALHPSSIRNFGHSLEEIWEQVVGSGYTVKYRDKEMEKQDFVSRSDLFDVFLTGR